MEPFGRAIAWVRGGTIPHMLGKGMVFTVKIPASPYVAGDTAMVIHIGSLCGGSVVISGFGNGMTFIQLLCIVTADLDNEKPPLEYFSGAVVSLIL